MSGISVIIPTLNEAENITAALESVSGHSRAEAIVVDGGSDDGTPELAKSFGARVIITGSGRALQMNAGAKEAGGEILLFLHADTRLPDLFEEEVRNGLSRPGTAAGCFSLRIDGSSWKLRTIEKVVNWRSRRLGLPYGDQALFLRAGLFRELGGYPDMPILEDLEFVRMVRRRGRIVTSPDAVVTSGRRWREAGPWRRTLVNQAILLAYFSGLPPRIIARWYYGKTAS